jgi:CRISPR/Cas system CMR subunit Cmr4 (Cas7 group RAMP superfamily)
MGLIVKRNEEGKYQLIGTIADERYHEDEWITEDEAKKILIEQAFFDFLERAIKIDMTFPSRYRIENEDQTARRIRTKIDDEKEEEYQNFNKKMIDSDDYFGDIWKKGFQIFDRLKINLTTLED